MGLRTEFTAGDLERKGLVSLREGTEIPYQNRRWGLGPEKKKDKKEKANV